MKDTNGEKTREKKGEMKEIVMREERKYSWSEERKERKVIRRGDRRGGKKEI